MWLANWKSDWLWHFIGRIPKIYIGRYFRWKNGMTYGKLRKVSVRPRGVSEEKTREKHGEKKGAENDLPYTYGDATSGAVISDEVTIYLMIHLKY